MKLTGTAMALAVAFATAAGATEVAPTDVVYDEYGAIQTSLSGAPGDVANGEVIMVTRGKGNCIACHAVTELEYAPFHGEVGPTLDGVGDRWGEAELRGIIANAKLTYDGTIMPAFYKTTGFIRPGDAYTGEAPTSDLPPILTAQEVEDVVAYLMTLKEDS